MVVTTHMRCPICGGAFGAWYSSDMEEITCPFCMMGVHVSTDMPHPEPRGRRGSWLIALLGAVIKRPVLTRT